MAGEYNTEIRSMTWEEDGLYQASAAINHGTLYTVTDYSGKGILFAIGYYNSNSWGYAYLQLTTDGNAHVWDVDANAHSGKPFVMAMSAAEDLLQVMVPMHIEFTTSLLFEIGNDAGTAYNIAGHTHYGILSKEFKREIITAGHELPGREHTYPFDVMVVWFEGDHGISNKIQFPKEDKVDLWLDNGKIAGQLSGLEYSTEVGGPRYVESKREIDAEKVVEMGGKKYSVPIIAGLVDETGIAELAPEKTLENEFAKKTQPI